MGGRDLGSKLDSLTKSLWGNSDARSQLNDTVKSLLGGGRPADSLSGLQRLASAANLTPPQRRLATWASRRNGYAVLLPGATGGNLSSS